LQSGALFFGIVVYGINYFIKIELRWRRRSRLHPAPSFPNFHLGMQWILKFHFTHTKERQENVFMLKAAFLLNMIWVSVILGIILWTMPKNMDMQGAILLGMSISYFVSSIYMMRRIRWAVALCMAITLLSLLYWSAWTIEMGALIFYYGEDPAPTIFIMAAIVVFFVFPALTQYVLYALSWRDLKVLFMTSPSQTECLSSAGDLVK